MDFFGNQNTITDISNLSTAESYGILEFESTGREHQMVDYLNGIPVEEFNIAGMQIDSPGELTGLTVTKRLDLCWSDITSLDGLEEFEGIQVLKLSHAEGLTDLSPVNNIKSLQTVKISSDMEELADQIDDRIKVEIED